MKKVSFSKNKTKQKVFQKVEKGKPLKSSFTFSIIMNEVFPVWLLATLAASCIVEILALQSITYYLQDLGPQRLDLLSMSSQPSFKIQIGCHFLYRTFCNLALPSSNADSPASPLWFIQVRDLSLWQSGQPSMCDHQTLYLSYPSVPSFMAWLIHFLPFTADI